MTTKPRVGISRCLLGDEVRYDGTHKRADAIIRELGQHVDWVTVCPEVEVGMGTPREPIHLVADPDGVASAGERVRLLGLQTGRDWTSRMADWARHRVEELRKLNLSGFVLKAYSPSCGIAAVRVAHPSSSAETAAEALETRTGRGLFAQALVEAMPDLVVADEEQLGGAQGRAAFLQRLRDASRR